MGPFSTRQKTKKAKSNEKKKHNLKYTSDGIEMVASLEMEELVIYCVTPTHCMTLYDTPSLYDTV